MQQSLCDVEVEVERIIPGIECLLVSIGSSNTFLRYSSLKGGEGEVEHGSSE